VEATPERLEKLRQFPSGTGKAIAWNGGRSLGVVNIIPVIGHYI
jgi:hypothetical protein